MRKMRSDEEVTLNLASMLDMAFQLLAFFILTFQPPAAESVILMRMPPPLAVVGGGTQSAGQDESKTAVKPAKTLLITVIDKDGGIDFLQVGVPSIAPMAQIQFPQPQRHADEVFQGLGRCLRAGDHQRHGYAPLGRADEGGGGLRRPAVLRRQAAQ